MSLPSAFCLLDNCKVTSAGWGVDTATRLMCTGFHWSPKGDQTQRENWYVTAPRESHTTPHTLSGRYIRAESESELELESESESQSWAGQSGVYLIRLCKC